MTRTEAFADKKNTWRFKFAISAILIAFMIGVTLRKLTDFGVTLEKENVYGQIKNFNLGLTEAWVSRNIAHKNTNISAFENTNPMLLISDVPNNYIGELNERPKNEKSVWFYNKETKRLTYILNNGELMEYTLTKKSMTSNKTNIPTGGLDLTFVQTK